MANDYASRTTSRKPSQPKVMPGWVWLVSGVLIGLFVAGLVYLSQYAKTLPADAPTATRQKVEPKKTNTADIKAELIKSRREVARELTKAALTKFDFYTILPDLEVVIPESETLSPDSHQESGEASKKQGTYLLQAGSFRKSEQADSLKARLALLGFDVSVETVTIKDNETWHRVRIGPYTDVSALESARSRLRRNDVYTILVKLKQ